MLEVDGQIDFESLQINKTDVYIQIKYNMSYNNSLSYTKNFSR